MHSCKTVPIELHFQNKELAHKLYMELFAVVQNKVGPCKEISLSCCIHWFGTYDYIALLPKKDKLEVRFSLDKEIQSPRIYASVPLSSTTYKNCLYIRETTDINDELLQWIQASYSLKST